MARLIPQKQIEEINQFKDSISVANSVFISGSLLVSQSIDIGSVSTDKQRITGSVEITGSLELDGTLTFKDAQSRLDATASFADESVDTQRFGGISVTEFGGSDATIYVSATRGSDDNDGRSPQFPLRTIKKAAQIATPGDDGRYGLPTGSNFTGFRIDVDTGTYVEDNPIELPRNTTVWGSGLRVTKIIAKNQNEDLFWVNSGCYLAEMTFGGLRVYPSVDVAAKGFAVAFAPNAFITTSPYVQNCSMISNQENSFLEAYEDIPPGGGGLNVDGNRIHPDSPLASMVLDAYTQVAPNGVGCQVVGRGFIQLVSFFTNFSAYSVKVIDGGQAVLLNSNTSFGDYGMYASGSRFITGSGGNQAAFVNVQNNYSIIVDTIEDGLSAIPPLVTNTENGYRATDPNVIPQYFTSADSTAEIAEIAKSDFRLVTSVIENGDTNEVALVAKSSTTGYSSASVYNISGDTQITSSLSASADDIKNINTNYTILLDIIDRGNAATSSYTQVENTSASIYVGDVEQYSSGISVTSTTKKIVGDRFDEVIDIITNGPTFADTLITNTSASFKFSSETPYESDVVSSDAIVQSVSESIAIVYNILDNGTGSNAVPTIIPSSSVPNPTVEYQNAYELLINNIPFIQEETILYLSSSWSEFEYNQETCKRDVGYIVSGAAHDLLYGGNEESVRSGIFYYKYPSDATTTQKDPTLTAIKYVRGLTENILKNRTFRDTNSDIDNGYDVLFNNKDFIREETIAYLSSSWSTFDYNEAKCRRDLGYIIDAVGTDLLYDGNERTLEAGNFYYKYPSLATTDNRTDGQKQQTLDGIKYAKRLAEKLVNNDTFVTASQSVQSAASLARQNRSLIQDETITYINTKYPTFSYNEAKCRRDTGYIIDNVITDLVYGGNERSELAGLYYYLYPSIANTTQLEETLEGIRYSQGFLREVVSSNLIGTPQVVLNTDGNIRVTSYTSTTGSISGGNTELQIVSQSFGIIEDIIRYGQDDVISAIAANSADIEWTTNSPINTSGRTQITSSNDESENLTTITNNYKVVTDIINGGTSSTPALVTNWSSSLKATSTEQYLNTGSVATSTEANLVSASISIVDTVVANGTSSLPSLIENTDGLIKVGNVSQVTSLNSASAYEVNRVSSSIALISQIVEEGTSVIPEIEFNISESVRFTTAISQFTGSLSGSLEDINFISSSISIVTNIIANGTGSVPAITDYTSSISSSNVLAAYEIIKENLDFIKDETIAYLSSSWSTASYDESKCRRDVGFIISGAAEDLLWNANSSSVVNGVYYYEYPSQAQGAQLNQTLDGIIYASKLTQKLIQNIEFTTASSERKNSWDLITNNKEFIQEETINYLSSSWSTFDYNEITCRRDVGYILDAIKTDIYYGGNERSVVAGDFYYRYPSQATGSQLQQTLDGIRYAGRVAENVIQSNQYVSPSQAVLDAKDLLFNNKTFVQNEVIAFISSSWSEFEYNETTCKRDVGYILDAAITDLVYGGNERSRIAAEYYYRYPSAAIVGGVPSVTQQKDPTVDGIRYAGGISTQIILGNEFTSVDSTKVTIKNSIISRKSYIQQNVLDYINYAYPNLTYNQAKCYRDIGFITDAIVTDLVYGGNARSIQAGTFYYKFPSQATDSQKPETIDGINFGRDLTKLILKGSNSIEEGYDTVIDIIQSGSSITSEETIGTDSKGNPINTVGIPKSSYGDNLVKTVTGVNLPNDITITKNVDNNIKFNDNSQYTSSITPSSTEITKVSSSFSVVSDIIEFGISGSLSVSGSSDASTYFEVVTLDSNYNAFYFNKNQLSKFDDVDGVNLPEDSGSYDDGIKDPTLTLKRGELYTFSINSLNIVDGGSINPDERQPFYIKTQRKAGTEFQYTTGITNNGTTFGTLTFIVPFDAPDRLFYVNGNNVSASGVINIVDNLPLSDTQRYVEVPSKGQIEVVYNTIDNIKVTNNSQFSSSFSASVNDTHNVSSSFATVIDVLENGLDNLPTIVSNITGSIKKSSISQYTSSTDATSGIRNLVTSSFDTIIDILENGTDNIPTLDENISDLIKVTSTTQVTSSISAGVSEVSSISSSFATIIDVLKNGTSVLPTEILNTSSSIKVTNTSTYEDVSLSVGNTEIEKVSSSFAIVLDIVENGTGSIPTIVENVNENIKVGSVGQYISSSYSGSLEDVDFVSSSFAIVTSIITNGYNSAPTLVDYTTRLTTENAIASYEILKENIDFIQEETIAYLSSSWSTASYDEQKCRRDVGFIVSGAAEDLIWNANSASVVNGKFYFENPSLAETSQINQTLDGINYASRLAQKLIQNIEFVTASQERLDTQTLLTENTPFIQNETISYLSSSWSTFDYNEVTCKRDINYIIDAVKTDVVYGGNERSANAGEFYYLYPSDATGSQLQQTLDGIDYARRLADKVIQQTTFVTASNEASASHQLLRDNKQFIQDETIQYISASWSDFDYVESTCKRDVGYIVDAVATDILYGGNERTIEAADYYFRYPSDATGSQLSQTVDAINYARRLSENIVVNTQFASAPFSRTNGYDLIFKNRNLIQTEVVEYISSSWADFEYDDVKCARDVGYILDAVATDLLYGGNERSRVAGEFYYLYPSDATGSQLTQTVDGVKWAKSMTDEILQNNLFETASEQKLGVASLITENKKLIQDETIAYLSSSWSTFDYNESKCKRDVGYILDAVVTDFVYGGNERSAKAGEFYYLYPSDATGSQLSQTSDGISFAARLTNKLITNTTLVTASLERQTTYDLLFQNKSFIQDEVISYISSSWSGFDYIESKCRRDTGYIVDAVATDVLYGGNERSVTAGEFYYLFPSEATGSQLQQTLDGVRHAAGISEKLVQNTLFVTASSDVKESYDLILDNKELIQDNVIDFIDMTYPYFTYNRVKCRRDTGYIVDAIATDLLYGGNQRSVVAGTYYYLYPSEATTTQITETVQAIKYAKSLTKNIILNNELTIPEIIKNTENNIKFTNSSQYTGSSAISGNELSQVSSSFALVSDTIQNGTETLPAEIKNIDGLVKVNDIEQFTLSTSGSSTEVGIVSASIDLINDIIRLGTDNIPFAIAKHFQTSELDTPQNLTTGSYVTASGTYDVTDELEIVSSSVKIINDIIQSGTGSLPTQISNTTNTIKVGNVDQFIGVQSGSLTEIDLVKNRASIIEDVVQNGTGSLPTLVRTNSNTSNLIKYTDSIQATGSSGDKVQEKIISSSFGIVVDILNNGTGSLPTLVDYNTRIDAPKSVNAYNLLKDNISFIQDETIAFLSSSWTEFDYNEAKCRRDLGFIISGAAEDLIWNANSSSIVNGKFYYEYPSQATGSQLQQTLDGIIYASNMAQNIVRGRTYVTASQNVSASFELLRNNREFIKEETIAFVSSSWSDFYYSESKCRRDTGYIVDAIATDLLYGGNERSTIAAEYYYRYPSAAIVGGVPNENQQKDPTVTAINYIKGLVGELVSGSAFVSPSNEVEYTYDSIRENREFIQNETVAFINAKYPDLIYNEASCSRDTGFIVDAIATDLRWGGNQRSITAGEFYYKFPSKAITFQSSSTIDGVVYIKDLIEKIANKETLSIPQRTLNTNSNIKFFTHNQYTGSLSGSLENIAFVSSSIDIVTTIIVNGTGSYETASLYGVRSTDPSTLAAYDIIKQNIDFIKDETIAYLSSSWSTSSYDEEKCKRDVGFIISGAAEDLVYNTYSASIVNGKYYYEFPSEANGTGSQINQTLDGIFYASRITQKLIQNIEFETASLEVSSSYNLIRENREFIQSESISYLSSSWSSFDYNEEKCKRDITHIIDAVSTDILYGGNERSITAGNFYYKYPSSATTAQVDPTTTGINYAGDVMEKLIQNNEFVTASAERIAGNKTLLENRSFIQNEVIAYISSSWSNFEYNEASCSRDTGYIVDAVATDLLYGGNERSRTAGEYYYLYPSEATTTQANQTTDGVKYASGIAQKLVQNIEFVTASNEASASWNLLRDNKEFIQNEVIAYVSSSWSGVYYDEEKCKRDVGYLIDATATDLFYGGNERSVTAGSYYWRYPSRATNKGVPSEENQLDPTIDGIRYAKGLSQKVIQNVEFTTPSNATLVGAELLIENKNLIQNEVITFLSSSWSEFEYNQEKCFRDVGYIIDAVRTDLVYGGNERSLQAGRFYYYIPSVAITEQKPQTIDGIDFAKGLAERVILKDQLVRPPFNTRVSVDLLRANKKTLQGKAISYTNGAFPDFVYNEDKCYRDTGFILDAIATDLFYGGNERSIEAAKSYYNGVYGDASAVVNEQKYETAETNRFLRTQFQRIVRNSPLELFGSLIITTGHDFSYAGSGVTYKALPPNQGGAGVPDPTKEITEIGGGRVYFTSGNELGDFRIGAGLVINQATGTLQGRTFSRSLFSLVTPFSLALQD